MGQMINLRGNTIEFIAAVVAWRNAEARARLSGAGSTVGAGIQQGQYPRALAPRETQARNLPTHITEHKGGSSFTEVSS